MSGPWEDFAPTTAATPAVVDQKPWEQFAPAADAPAAAPTPARTPEEVHATVTKMIGQKAPFSDIENFVSSSGYSVDPETRKWFEKNYSPAPDKPAQHYDVNVRGPREPTNALNSAWHGLQSGALRGYDDEWAGLFGAIGNEIGSGLGLNKSTGSFVDRYTQIRDNARAAKDAALQDHPWAYAGGFIPGAVTGPVYFRSPAKSLIGRVGQAAGAAGVEGALSGSGNADGGVGDRLLSGAEGAGAGMLLGTAGYPIGVAGGRLLGRLAERLRPANGVNALNSGLDVLASRAPQSGEDMAARAEAMTSAGVPPRLVDVVDEGGRGIIRAAATKNTPAREDLAQHAAGVYQDTQDRVAAQARKHISPAPNTARQVAERVSEEQTAMGPRFDAVRDNPVDLTPDIVKALNTSEGRSALRTVSRYMTPDEQKGVTSLISAIGQLGKVDPRLPQPVQDQMRAAIMQGANFTVDMADKVTRILERRAGDNPAMMRVAKNMGQTIRGAARTQHPEYDAALNDFANLKNIGNAAEGTGKFEGTSDFLQTPPDQYGSTVAGANANPTKAGDETFPSEQDVLRVRARDQVVDRATAGSGAQAPSVARQIAYGSKETGQGARTRALIGEDSAQALEHGMRQELKRLGNTQHIDPNIGSKTAPMREDIQAADDSAHFALDVASHGHWGIVRGVSRWLKSSGIRGIDAERLTRDAISEDPQKLQNAMNYLSAKGLDRARSRSLLRQIQRNAANLPGRAAGAFVSDEKPSAPPNSVRAVLKQGAK